MIDIDEKGTVITEFAIVIPIVLLMIFGMVQLLFIVNAKAVIQQAAFDAVRSAAVYSDETHKAQAIAEEQTAVLANAAEAPEIIVTQVNDEMNVKVRAKISLLPFIKQAIMSVGGSGEIELVATAVAKKEPYFGR